MIEPIRLPREEMIPARREPFPLDSLTYLRSYRYSLVGGSWTSWTSYTPGESLTFFNGTTDPLHYLLELRTNSYLGTWLYDSVVVERQFTVMPTPLLKISGVEFTGEPFTSGDQFRVLADVTTEPLYETPQTATVTAAWYLYKDTEELVASGSTTLSLVSGTTYQSPLISSPVWEEYEPVTQVGSGTISVWASLPGTITPNTSLVTPRPGCWVPFGVPEPDPEYSAASSIYRVWDYVEICDEYDCWYEVAYSPWAEDSYSEAGLTTVSVPNADDPMDTVYLSFDYYESNPEAVDTTLDIIVISPSGTQVSVRDNGWSPLSGYWVIPLFGFSGDPTSLGTWIVKAISGSSGGMWEGDYLDISLIKIKFTEDIKPATTVYSMPDILTQWQSYWEYSSYDEAGFSARSVTVEPASTDLVWISLRWEPSSDWVWAELVSPVGTSYTLPLDEWSYGDYEILTTHFKNEISAIGEWSIRGYDEDYTGGLSVTDILLSFGGVPDTIQESVLASADIPRSGYSTDSWVDSGLTTFTTTNPGGKYDGPIQITFDVSNALGGSLYLHLKGPTSATFFDLSSYSSSDFDSADMTEGPRVVNFTMPWGASDIGEWVIKAVASAGQGYDISNLKLWYESIEVN